MLSDSSITHYDKEMLIRRISNIKNNQCYMDILDLIHTRNILYTVNSNGIYFNLTTIPDDAMHIIMDIVGHYESKKRLREKPHNNN